MKPLRVAVVGCGHIRTQYGLHIQKYPELLELVGATDLDVSRAEEFCKEFGGKAYPDFEALLADPDVDVVINLTIHHAHFEINSRALRAGKHVLTEKPLALTFAEARELCALAREVDRRLVCAPTTFLGEGIQSTARYLDAVPFGTLRLVYAEVNWAQIERWISSPAAYFTVGPLLDVGVYAITAMTFLLGPARRVWGYSTILKNPRQDQHGNSFPVTAPDFTVGMIEFASGVVARLTTNYYVHRGGKPHLVGLEFHGDDASFAVSDYHNFNAVCRYIPYGSKEALEVPLLREPDATMDRAIGLADLAYALAENRPHRGSAEHATHVLEIMEGLQRSACENTPVEITSVFEKPALLDWAREAEVTLPTPPSA